MHRRGPIFIFSLHFGSSPDKESALVASGERNALNERNEWWSGVEKVKERRRERHIVSRKRKTQKYLNSQFRWQKCGPATLTMRTKEVWARRIHIRPKSQRRRLFFRRNQSTESDTHQHHIPTTLQSLPLFIRRRKKEKKNIFQSKTPNTEHPEQFHLLSRRFTQISFLEYLFFSAASVRLIRVARTATTPTHTKSVTALLRRSDFTLFGVLLWHRFLSKYG